MTQAASAGISAGCDKWRLRADRWQAACVWAPAWGYGRLSHRQRYM